VNQHYFSVNEESFGDIDQNEALYCCFFHQLNDRL